MVTRPGNGNRGQGEGRGITPGQLHAYRLELGLTQAELGAALGLTANTVARWERGESPIGNPELVALAIQQLESGDAVTASRHSARPMTPTPIEERHPAGRAKHNLPVERTSLIGRRQELAAIRQVLLESDGRLVTLTGPGGAGKTRLAQRLGRDLIELFRDGVWLVEVAAETDPERLPQTVASILGVRERRGEPVLDTLVAALSPQEVLLVLDNCEHLVDACADLADALLSRCPRVRLLATSREPLHLVGEVDWRVPPLAVPEMRSCSTLDDLACCAAVQLFVDRARSVRSDFALTARNASAVAEICTLLEGLPLALELAAARVRVLGIEQIQDQLRNSLWLLVDEKRSTTGRHRSLDAALDWSYTLLSEPERTVFRRLAAFADSWTLQAAEEVCGDDELPRANVHDVLAQLVDKSLVLMEEQDGQARYRLLEPVRQYADVKLRAGSEALATRRRHAGYFAKLSEWLESTWTPRHARSIHARRLRELANFRAAMGWSIDLGEPETGLRLAAGLAHFWTFGWLSEGRDWFARLLNDPASPHLTPARAKALQLAGNTAYYQGDHSAAAALVAESVALWRQLGDPAGLAQALDEQGLNDRARGELESAKTALISSLELARALGVGDLEERCLYHLGLVTYDLGDLEAANDWHTRSMAVAMELSDAFGQARAYYGLGLVAHQRSDLVAARALHEAGLARRREVGESWGMALALVALGQVSLDEKDLAGARALFQESLLLSRELGDKHGLARSLEGMAAVAARVEPERAIRLAGASAALRDAADAPMTVADRERIDQQLSPAQVALGGRRRGALMAEASFMSLDEAIELALSVVLDGSVDASPTGGARVSRTSRLTGREAEVLCLIARGMSNKEIAGELVLSVRTVERHITNLYAKIGARGKADATAYALRHNLT